MPVRFNPKCNKCGYSPKLGEIVSTRNKIDPKPLGNCPRCDSAF